MSVNLNVQSIAALCLHTPEYFGVQLGQTQHRVNLVSKWDIREGDKVLEIGCGQGDTTAVLATAVGETGSATAINPPPLNHRSRITLSQAQAHLSTSPSIGKRLSFVQADPLTYITSSDIVFDVAVLAHSVWYFSSPSVLLDILRTLATHARRVCIAEYALTTSSPSAVPHLIAVLTQASMEVRKVWKAESLSNVHTILSPKKIKEMAQDAQLILKEESIIMAPKDMYDGRWETSAVLDHKFQEDIKTHVKDERERSVVEALRDSVRASKAPLGDVKISTMDIWYGVYKTNV